MIIWQIGQKSKQNISPPFPATGSWPRSTRFP
nr:MAG TPA: hypothetical protein [Caudoviricetes sp.]